MAGPKIGSLSVLIVLGYVQGLTDLSALPKNRLAAFILRVEER